MIILNEIKSILGSVLNIDGRVSSFTLDTPLLGSVPELDSMAVVSVVTAIEEHFEINFDDDEITAEVFENMCSLTEAVERKL